MPTTSRREQHDLRQQHEHAEALKRKAERRDAHERRMRQQADDATRARAERARRHKELKEEEGRRRREKEARRGWGSPGSSSSGSTHSSWSEYNYSAHHYYHPRSATDASLKREQERAAAARYEANWECMRRIAADTEGQLRFADIPWPSIRPVLSLPDMTPADIESFLLSEALNPGMNRRARLRAFMLQWHPDKFIGRWLQHVCERDRATVQEGVTTVASVANQLLSKLGH